MWNIIRLLLAAWFVIAGIANIYESYIDSFTYSRVYLGDSFSRLGYETLTQYRISGIINISIAILYILNVILFMTKRKKDKYVEIYLFVIDITFIVLTL